MSKYTEAHLTEKLRTALEAVHVVSAVQFKVFCLFSIKLRNVIIVIRSPVFSKIQ